MKTVLVAGACGFLGSHVCEYFANVLGWKVIGIDNMTQLEFVKSGYKGSDARYHNWNYLSKNPLIKLQYYDIVHGSVLHKMEYNDFDYIINCAAQPTMTLSIEDPMLDFNVNVLGALNLLELARKKDVPIALCSSIHIYGNLGNKSLKEKDTRFESLVPHINEQTPILQGDMSPLHASKVAMEDYGRCYADTYKLKVGIFRFTGMYGPRQFAGMHHGWVSNFIIRVLKDLPIYIFGTDKQVRDILYATDAVRIFSKFWYSQTSGIYNVGSGVEGSVSLNETLSMIADITGKSPNIVMEPHRFGDLYYFVCDISKAEDYLGWKPTVSPMDGLGRTVAWIKNNIGLFGGIQ